MGVVYMGSTPTQDASHHQDYETFLVWNPYKPAFAAPAEGLDPTHII